MLDAEAILPVWNADWIVSSDGRQLAKVRSVYSMDGQVYMDIYLYSAQGVKLSRQSPHMGGPRTFEPSIDFDPADWLRVAKPKFPLNDQPRWVPGEPGVQQARITLIPDLEVLPFRESPMRQRLVKSKKIGWTDEERQQILKDARVRSLLSQADTLEKVTEGAFVVMSTADIRERAADLRAQAAQMEAAE